VAHEPRPGAAFGGYSGPSSERSFNTLWFLSNTQQYAAIPPMFSAWCGGGERRSARWGRDDLIASSLDHVLASGDLHTGLQIWTTLRDGRWITQSVPDANHPLTNGDFRLGLSMVMVLIG
jgi:hypothetical protein